MNHTDTATARLLKPLLGLLLLLAALTPASAHKASDTYLRLELSAETIEQRTDIALRDLDRELVLDADDDGQLSWGEVRAQWPQIARLAQAGIVLQADGQPCQPGAAGAAQLDTHSDGRYAVLTRRWTCPAPVRELSVGYSLFAASDPTHRGILSLSRGTAVRTAVLVPGAAPQRFAAEGPAAGAGPGAEAGPGAPSSFFGFVAEGIHHILIGTDHVLFLLALLLPAVLLPALLPERRRPPAGGWALGRPDPLAASRLRHSLARTAPPRPAPAPYGGGAAATLPWR
ncbi:MAG TPA: HupE/UreJ family protein, partial [Ideonella sp.]|nr:HupE/UreJ family protein [Ideonella sp.]